MIREKLKVNFVDFWPNFNKTDNYLYQLLERQYDLEISEWPDVLFFSVYDFQHLNYNCFKVFYTGENVRPNYNECDFSLSFDYEDYKQRNFRLPLYKFYGSVEKICNTIEKFEHKDKFCNFIYSNSNNKKRNEFYKCLSKYRTVDSGGFVLNNLGYRVDNKLDFIKDYRFTIAFENSSYPGYTTEKIFEPMLVNSIPIYWGNPLITREFNSKSFINVHDFPNFNEVVKYIRKVDESKELYNEIVSEPFFVNDQIPDELHDEFILEKLIKIIEKKENTSFVSKNIFNRNLAKYSKYRKIIFSKFGNRPFYYY